MKKNKYFLISILMIVFIIDSKQTFSKEELKIDQFISPETCGDCHSELYDQWQYSMHNLSHKDIVYNEIAILIQKGLTDKGEIQEAESCVKCHTPVGNITGFPKKFSDDLSKTPEIAQQGIQCDYCHSSIDIKKMFNNGLVLSPGQGEDEPGIKYGPFDDSEPEFHEAKYSKIHTKAQICGTCHDVNHVKFKTNLETTYTEWKNSPYNAKDPEKKVVCQDCHMYQRPGIPATGSTKRPKNPGTAADDSIKRDHIFTHYFTGANTSIPAGFDKEIQKKMAIERLKNAATLSFYISKNKRKIIIKVNNSGAGHSIPTGVANFRQVWLEVSVKDGKGSNIFNSGFLNKKGELEKNSFIFNTVFGDENNKPVVNIAKARKVLKNNTIPAKSSVTRVIKLSRKLKSKDNISIRLLYRGMPQSILNSIPKSSIEPFPVIEMAKVVKDF